MTTASSIITAAFRESNLIAAVASPTTTQQNEALDRLNAILASVFGFEVGEELYDLNIGGTYDQSSACSSWVPDNARLVLNLSGATTLKLSPEPYPGQRLAMVDAGNNLAANNFTFNGNGRTIEGSSTLTLSTSGMNRQWFYRGETGNWVKCADLALTDLSPFPEEFDDYFITRVASRLNPRYAQQITPETAAALKRSETQIQTRYRRPRTQQDLGTLGLLGRRSGGFDQPTSAFNVGRPRW